MPIPENIMQERKKIYHELSGRRADYSFALSVIELCAEFGIEDIKLDFQEMLEKNKKCERVFIEQHKYLSEEFKSCARCGTDLEEITFDEFPICSYCENCAEKEK